MPQHAASTSRKSHLVRPKGKRIAHHMLDNSLLDIRRWTASLTPSYAHSVVTATDSLSLYLSRYAAILFHQDMTEDDLRVAFEAQGGGPVDRVVIDPRRTVFAIVCYADRAHCAAALAKVPQCLSSRYGWQSCETRAALSPLSQRLV